MQNTLQNAEVPLARAGYTTELPDSFPIGRHKVQPRVNVTELQAHLRLLGAVHKLKQDVQAQRDGIAATDPHLAWIVYVNQAVCRFYAWAAAPWDMGTPGFNETAIPPLDVVMVWHSYLLATYYEDSMRMDSTYATNLQIIETMSLSLISSLIDPQTLIPFTPSAERQEFFECTTSMPFTPPLIMNHSDTLSQPIPCPHCLVPNYLVKLVAADNKGFTQSRFEHLCERCRNPFTKESIGVKRFALELAKKRAGVVIHLSETLLDPKTGVVDVTAADGFIKRLFATSDDLFKMDKSILPIEIAEEAQRLATGLGYSYNTLLTKLHSSVRPKFIYSSECQHITRIQRLAAAYSHSGLASIDLVGAVLRQQGFIDKMVGLGWTQPNRFDRAEDLAPLVRSVARYHAFLDLMEATTSTFYVPTLDLSWHSHQLKGSQYRRDTMAFLGRTPNHDDSIEAKTLSTAYDLTAKAWRDRFGVPYNGCGRVPKYDQKSRVSGFITSLSPIVWEDKGPPPAFTPIDNRPDLISIEDEADGFHPCEHKVQFGGPWALAALENSREQKGAAGDAWRALLAKQNEKWGDHDQREDPSDGYGYYYYPYWGVSVTPSYG
ncbi:hypothetical protein BU17DRAFT_56356 [Hysterangium stoloniferum]|nr:hypothetical protein BU17DRAFT_56356 [Hysterangium stoloniferum]